MNSTLSLEAARDRLAQEFGRKWRVCYDTGKADMTEKLMGAFELKRDTARLFVEEMERQGMIRFRGAHGYQESSPARYPEPDAGVTLGIDEECSPESGCWELAAGPAPGNE